MAFIGEVLSLLAALFWAVGVVLFKKSGESMPPLGLNLFKNALAIMLLVPTIPLASELFFPPDQPLENWLLLVGSGIIGIAIADTLFFISLRRLGAGLTAVVDTSYTPIMLAMSWLVLDEKIGSTVLVGGTLIMIAMLVGSATRPGPGLTRRDVILGTVIGIVGITLMGFGVIMIKGILETTPYIWATTVRMVSGFLALLPVVLLGPGRKRNLAVFKKSAAWKYAIPASFFGSYLAMVCWIGGMKYTMVSVATLLNQTTTIFIFILATLFLKEPLTRRRVVAIMLAFSGALFVVLR